MEKLSHSDVLADKSYKNSYFGTMLMNFAKSALVPDKNVFRVKDIETNMATVANLGWRVEIINALLKELRRELL